MYFPRVTVSALLWLLGHQLNSVDAFFFFFYLMCPNKGHSTMSDPCTHTVSVSTVVLMYSCEKEAKGV